MKLSRILGAFLALALVLTSLPVFAFAQADEEEEKIVSSTPEEDDEEQEQSPEEPDDPGGKDEEEDREEDPGGADPDEEGGPDVYPDEDPEDSVLFASADAQTEIMDLEEFLEAVTIRYVLEDYTKNSGEGTKLTILYTVTTGELYVLPGDVKLLIRFPAELTVPDPVDNELCAATARVDPDNGDTLVEVVFKRLDRGSGGSYQIDFHSTNGVLDDGTVFLIGVEGYYEDERFDEDLSDWNDVEFTVAANKFDWSDVTHSPAARTLETAAGDDVIPDLTVHLQTIPSTAVSGLVYTKSVEFTETINVNYPEVLVPYTGPGSIEVSDNAEITAYNTVTDANGDTYITDFTMQVRAENDDPVVAEIGWQNPWFKISGAAINTDEVDLGDTVNMLSKDSFSGTAVAAYQFADAVGDGYTKTLSSGSLDIKATLTPTPEENKGDSRGIRKALASINGGATNEHVITGDVATYRIDNFANKQQGAMTSFTITDSFDPVDLTPFRLTTGIYTPTDDLTGTYKIYCTVVGQSTPVEIGEYSYTSNETVPLVQVLEAKGYSFTIYDIDSIIFEYGAVPAKFAPDKNTAPTIAFRVMEQYDDNGDVRTESKGPLVNRVDLAYEYEGATFDAYNESEEINWVPKAPTPEDPNWWSSNKTHTNLTSPGAEMPMAGDLLEFKIEAKNEIGIDLYHIEVEEEFENLSYYASPILSGYDTFNVKAWIVDKDGVRVEATVLSVDATARGVSPGSMVIKLDPTEDCVPDQGTLYMTYVMEVNEDVQQGDVISNYFKAFGSPLGQGHIRYQFGGGGSGGSSTGQYRIPTMEITQSFAALDGTAIDFNDRLQKDDRIQVTVTVGNRSNAHEDGYATVANVVTTLGNGALLIDPDTSVTIKYPLADGTYATKSVPASQVEIIDGNGLSGDNQNLKFDLVKLLILPEDGVDLYKTEDGEEQELTITFTAYAARDALSDANANEKNDDFESIQIQSFAFVTQKPHFLRQEPTGINEDKANMDQDPATLTYFEIPNILNLVRADMLYASMTVSAAPNPLDLKKDPNDPDLRYIRDYTIRLSNNSILGVDLDVTGIVAELPLYERILIDADHPVVLNYNDAASYGIGAEQVVIIGNRQVVQFTDLVGPLNAAPGYGITIEAAPESDNFGGFIEITFSAEIPASLWESAVQRGKEWSDRITPAFYVEEGTLLQSWSSTVGAIFDTVDSDDWDGDAATTSHWRPNPYPVQNIYSAVVVPGVEITPYVVSSGGVNTPAEGQQLSPYSVVAWKVEIANGAQGTETIVDPTIVVALPGGMIYTGLQNEASLTWITDLHESTVRGRTVLVIETDLSLDPGDSQAFFFNVNSEGSGYGSHTATAYQVPPADCIFFESLSPSTQVLLHLKNLTGLDLPGYDAYRDMVQHNGTVKMSGVFAFSSQKVLHAGEGLDARTVSSNDGYPVIEFDERAPMQFSYDLILQNGSTDKDYNNVVLIDRMPGVGDLGNKLPIARGSSIDVHLTAAPVVYLSQGSGWQQTSNVTIEYTDAPRDTIFNSADYGADSMGTPNATWDSSLDPAQATAFRISLDQLGKTTEVLVEIEAQFAVAPEDFPDKDAEAWNSFGFAFDVQLHSQLPEMKQLINAEPAPVGIKFHNQYFAEVEGHIFIDRNQNGEYDEDTEYFYSRPVTVTASKTETPPGGGSDVTDQDGYYFIDRLLPDTEYEVTFTIPRNYKLTEIPTDPVGLIYHSFEQVGSQARIVFRTDPGRDSRHAFHAGLVYTGGGSGGGGGGSSSRDNHDRGTTTITDDEIPLGNLPDLVTIIDDETPLGALPATGGSGRFILLGIGCLLVWITAVRRKNYQ